ncbi:MAG: SRPBCC domain-containing protein [Acidobacteriia bacterium]|nr:SRPBCC domain-containing protein [Terriglobia bacterium]
MADIFHDFPIKASPDKIFDAVTTPRGLDAWWTKRSAGEARDGAEFELWFGPQYDWRAKVTKCAPNSVFELQMTRADADWTGTRIGFHLQPRDGSTFVQFHHTGWPQPNQHWRISNYCWAMYLRILRRYLEHGELAPYEKRLDV